MAKPKVRDLFSPSEDEGISFVNDCGMTDGSQARECDVNVIVDRFMKTGVLPGTDAGAMYGDFSAVPDYQSALGIVARAEEQFASLTAAVRKRFDNDPAAFLSFCNDPKNKTEMAGLGLLGEAAAARVKEDARQADLTRRSEPPIESGEEAPAASPPSQPAASAPKGGNTAKR